MIGIYVTHYSTKATVGLADITIDTLHQLRRTMPRDSSSKLCLAYWTDDPAQNDDLARRAPSDVELVLNDRPGRPDSQPSARNKVIAHARASGCEAFVLLHNDIRPALGWLDRLVGDWRAAEARWGRHSAIVTPRFIPYHLAERHPDAEVHRDFWINLLRWPNVVSGETMAAWCRSNNFEFTRNEVVCPPASQTTDDGHALMMFIASPECFTDVGECDEQYLGANYDDSDWGIRALLAGKKNLKSTGALIGHIEGLSFYAPQHVLNPIDNAQLFIAKWGRPLFDEMQTGALWQRLHSEQLGVDG
jgi:hypothetical protein